MTVNGTPVDYQSIHPLCPMENGPARVDVYSRPHYKWDPTVDDLGSSENGLGINTCSFYVHFVLSHMPDRNTLLLRSVVGLAMSNEYMIVVGRKRSCCVTQW